MTTTKNFILLLATIFDITKQKREDTEHSPHLNPRAVILKRQARDRIVPNIPLPFNNIHGNTTSKQNQDPIMKVKRFVKNIKNEHDKIRKPDRVNAIKKENTIGMIGDEQDSTRSIIDSTRSIIDTNSSTPMTNKTKKREIVRDARSVPEEQLSKLDAETTRNDIYKKAVPFEELKSLDIVKRALNEEQFNRLRFLDDEKV